MTGTREPKYLFPKLLPGTGRYLYNAHNIVRTEDVVVAEGAFDVIATKMALDEDQATRHVVPIGTFGKHLSSGLIDGNDQASRLRKLKHMGVKRVTMMYDGTPDALIAALDACRIIAGIGMTPRIALLPAGKDQNEVAGEVVRQAFWEAKTWNSRLNFKWRLSNPYRA